MLKLLSPGWTKFSDFKCGEIFCLTVSSYAATCNICSQKLDFRDFPKHFQRHLSDNADEPQPGDEKFSTSNTIDKSIKEKSMDHEDLLGLPNIDDENLINLEDLKSNESDAIVLTQPEPVIADEKYQKEETQHSFGDEDFENSGDEWQDEDNSSSDESVKEGEDGFACRSCYRCFKSRQGLKVHLTIMHGPKNKRKPKPLTHKCDVCGKFFRTESVLCTHKIKHTGVDCDVCGRKFSQVGALARHKIRHTGVKSQKCDECDKSFYTEQELSNHKKRHAGMLNHICEVCGKRCFDQGVLTAHMRRHTGERPAKCDVCGKSFFSFYDLNVHAVAHSDLRPFKCDICGGMFQRKKALRVHKKTHNTAEKNHFCQICRQAFAAASGLTAHKRLNHLEQQCFE